MDPSFIYHRLNVDPSYPPKKQKPQKFAKAHVEVVKEEVEKLKLVGAIKEVIYLEWLANIVLVKKKKREIEGLRRLH